MARRWHPMMFYNELDWLECQLWETYEVMYRYIIVEATLDHQGHPKPLYYDDNKSRFDQWRDKIIHVIVRDLPTAQTTANHWERERPQRDAAMPVLFEQGKPEDLIFNLDVDEIPSQTALAAETPEIKGLQLSNHLFAVDWYSEMNVMGSLVPVNCLERSMQPSELPGAVRGGLSWIREHRYGYPVIHNAGWHFSWVGGVDEYISKDQRTPHTEHHDERMRPGGPEYSYYEGAGQTPVDVGPDWPRYIRERRCPASWFRPR
jgi:Glycosyltransferase family 17